MRLMSKIEDKEHCKKYEIYEIDKNYYEIREYYLLEDSVFPYYTINYREYNVALDYVYSKLKIR